MTGVTQRSISSTAAGINDESARRRSRWSGCSRRASIPPEIRLRVVSLPATDNSTKNALNSGSVSASPSTSARMSVLIKSSRGRCLRSTASWFAYINI